MVRNPFEAIPWWLPVVLGLVMILTIHGYDRYMRTTYGVIRDGDEEFYTVRSERVPYYLRGVAHTRQATGAGLGFMLMGLALRSVRGKGGGDGPRPPGDG